MSLTLCHGRNVHYPDLLENPHLKKITLSTTSKKKAKLSSGAEVDGDTFYRMAQLHFDDAESYDQFITYFQVISAPTFPADYADSETL